MNAADLTRYITTTFAGVDVTEANGDSFFFYNPDPHVEPDHMFPIFTLVTSDINDQFSNLNRPGVYRLNLGVSKQTFRDRFGQPKLPPHGAMALDPADPHQPFDFTALDTLLPHPVYGRMYWVSILNPSDATFAAQVQPLLTEAYAAAVAKYKRQADNNAP